MTLNFQLMSVAFPRTSQAPDPEAVLAKAALNTARRLGLTNRDLADVLGTSEASVSRMGHGRVLRAGSAETELAALFVRLFRSLDALVGGDEAKARAWFSAHNHHLDAVPAHRVRSVEGLVDVVQYLDGVRGKL
jgi:hypothetical protein